MRHINTAGVAGGGYGGQGMPAKGPQARARSHHGPCCEPVQLLCPRKLNTTPPQAYSNVQSVNIYILGTPDID